MFNPDIPQQIATWLQEGFLVLDIETTGLSDDPNVDICEVAVLNHQGETLLHSLIKPRKPIPLTATAIHGIGTRDVQDAPSFKTIHPQLIQLLNGQRVIAYNAPFEEKILEVVCAREKLEMPDPAEWICAMRTYSNYVGVKRFIRLGVACSQEGIKVEGAHRATGDCRLTLALLKKVAEVK